MTRARAKQLSLAVLHKPHVVRWDRSDRPDVGYVNVGYAGDLHATYTQRADLILAEILTLATALFRQADPHARIFQVHDEILIETANPEAMKRIVVDALVTQHGVQIVPPRSIPLLAPA